MSISILEDDDDIMKEVAYIRAHIFSSSYRNTLPSSALANVTTTTDLPGREHGLGRVVGKGRVPGNVEDDAEGRKK